MFLCIEGGKNLDESKFYEKVKNKCKDCLKNSNVKYVVSFWRKRVD